MLPKTDGRGLFPEGIHPATCTNKADLEEILLCSRCGKKSIVYDCETSEVIPAEHCPRCGGKVVR